jgi:hypothetical protein
MATFNKSLSVKGDIEDFILTETKKLAEGVLFKVVKRTPYRTGQAKRNWIVSNLKPDNKFVKVPEESPLAAATAENIAINDGKSKLPFARPFQLIYIQNNAPYIVRLNNGYSLQAPALYVDLAILEEVNKR